jgi:hypothetical protein
MIVGKMSPAKRKIIKREEKKGKEPNSYNHPIKTTTKKIKYAPVSSSSLVGK